MNYNQMLMDAADNGSRVSGHYHGIPFTGVAYMSRQLTWSYDESLYIRLDNTEKTFAGTFLYSPNRSDTIIIDSYGLETGKHTLKIESESIDDLMHEYRDF